VLVERAEIFAEPLACSLRQPFAGELHAPTGIFRDAGVRRGGVEVLRGVERLCGVELLRGVELFRRACDIRTSVLDRYDGLGPANLHRLMPERLAGLSC